MLKRRDLRKAARALASPGAAALLHGVVGVARQMPWRLAGQPHGVDVWDRFWQAMDSRDLMGDFWRSLWHLHAQPPGYQLWGWAWSRLCGSGRFMTDMLWAYVAMGAAMTAMVWSLAFALTRSRRWATAAGLIMALNPSLLQFENFYLYDLPVAFLVLVAAWALWRAAERASAWAVGAFLAAVVALTLTRSAFHLVFLAGALAFAWPALRGVRLRVRVAVLVLALLPTAGWYAKNAVQYGFFGSSSWFGLGLYKCILFGNRMRGYGLEDEYRSGLVPEMVHAHWAFETPPSEYRRYGFDRESAVPSLARDDLHNINVPDIARTYGRVAKGLIVARPGLYLAAVHRSYCRFSRPAFDYPYLNRFDTFAPVPGQEILGQYVWGTCYARECELWTRLDFGSLFYFVYPALLLYFAVRCWGGRRAIAQAFASGSPGGGAFALLALWLLYASVYTTLASCLFECGENERFRFAIEGYNLVMAAAALHALWPRLCRMAVLRRGEPGQ